LVVASVTVDAVTAAVVTVEGAGVAVAGRRRRRSGCPAQSWAVLCSR
jgi:hypothetical protein